MEGKRKDLKHIGGVDSFILIYIRDVLGDVV
jgi:hypothetical protein